MTVIQVHDQKITLTAEAKPSTDAALQSDDGRYYEATGKNQDGTEVRVIWFFAYEDYDHDELPENYNWDNVASVVIEI